MSEAKTWEHDGGTFRACSECGRVAEAARPMALDVAGRCHHCAFGSPWHIEEAERVRLVTLYFETFPAMPRGKMYSRNVGLDGTFDGDERPIRVVLAPWLDPPEVQSNGEEPVPFNSPKLLPPSDLTPEKLGVISRPDLRELANSDADIPAPTGFGADVSEFEDRLTDMASRHLRHMADTFASAPVCGHARRLVTSNGHCIACSWEEAGLGFGDGFNRDAVALVSRLNATARVLL